MRVRLIVDTCFWGLSSAALLVFCVFFWWIVPIEEPPAENNVSLPQTTQPLIEFRETEIVHLGESGKEWSLKAKLISQKDMEVELKEITGYFFIDEKPFYSITASRGKVSLESGDALFWEVAMQEVGGERLLRGRLLQWIAREKKCILEEANFKDQNLTLRGDKMIYELKGNKLQISGDVVVNVKLVK